MTAAGTSPPLATLTQSIDALAAWAWRASWQAALLAVAVAAVTLLCRKKLTPACRFWLWSLVLLRLAMPTIVEIPWWRYLHTNPDPPQRTPTALQPTPVTIHQPIRLPDPSPTITAPTAQRQTARPRAELSTEIPAPKRFDLSNSIFRLLPWIWLTGALFISLRILIASLRLSRAVRRMPIIDDPTLLAALQDACRAMRLRRAPQAKDLPAPAGPALVGFLKPRILLPTSTLASLSAQELRLVLLHELAHVKRRDVLVNWIATLIAVLHWFNPAAWLVFWRMRVERELACDEMVLRAATPTPTRQDNTPHAYAHTILKLLESLSAATDPKAPPAGALRAGIGILEGREKAQIQRRLVMIARFDTRSRRWSVLGVSLALILTAAALTGVVSAQDPQGADPPNRQRPPQPRRTSSTEDPTVAQPAAATAAASEEKLARIKRNSPPLPPLSPHAQKLLADAIGSPNPPTDEHVGGLQSGLWKQYEKELIFVPGQGDPVNKQAVQQKFVQDVEALHKWLAAAAKTGIWDDASPNDLKTVKFADFPLLANPNDPATAKAREKLKKPMQVDFKGQALGDVIDFLRDASGVDVLVDWRGLEAVGIARDSPVDLRLNEPTSFDHILDLVLRTGTNGLAAHHLDRGVIMIIPGEQRANTMVTRAYDVADLTTLPGEHVMVVPGAAGHDPAAAAAPPPGFRGAPGVRYPQQDANQLAQLRSLIMQTVEPSTWVEAGGAGSIGAFGTKLIVKNSEPVHREIAELLAMLREKPAEKPGAKTRQ